MVMAMVPWPFAFLAIRNAHGLFSRVYLSVSIEDIMRCVMVMYM